MGWLKIMRSARVIAVLGVIGVLSFGMTRSAVAEEFRFSSYQQVLELFEDVEYTPEAWQAGIRVVPRLFLSNIPERWRGSVSKDITVQLKKRLFFRLLAPLALHSNELILADRERLLVLLQGDALGEDDMRWLADLAIRYRVIDTPTDRIDDAVRGELLRRVDIVPASLALAQAAEESGWGTSRFADQGNAIFGQWTWGEHGILPKEQRAGLGDYKIAAFESPLGSIRSYMRNLNTNAAYRELRAQRAAMRSDGAAVTGWSLAAALTSYSERGEEYVKSLRAIMRVNKLAASDVAYLDDGPATELIPVGAGAR
jgi:Bax protein